MTINSMITIVTATLKFCSDLLTTAESVYPCLSGNISWLIVSKEPLQHNGKLIRFESSRIRVITANDKGLYDALNISLNHVSSGYIQVVGGGDTIIRSGFDEAVKAIDEGHQMPVHAFPILLNGSGKIYPPSASSLSVFMSCPHPGIFVDVMTVKRIGGFDTRYKVSADYDLISRIAQIEQITIHQTEPVVKYKGGGMSEIFAEEAVLENALIRKRVWRKTLRDCITTIDKLYL